MIKPPPSPPKQVQRKLLLPPPPPWKRHQRKTIKLKNPQMAKQLQIKSLLNRQNPSLPVNPRQHPQKSPDKPQRGQRVSLSHRFSMTGSHFPAKRNSRIFQFQKRAKPSPCGCIRHTFMNFWSTLSLSTGKPRITRICMNPSRRMVSTIPSIVVQEQMAVLKSCPATAATTSAHS